MQAQLAVSPYIGLWTRLAEFQRDDLAHSIEEHNVVKATLMRATLHLATAEDYPWLRTTLQPVMTYAGRGNRKAARYRRPRRPRAGCDGTGIHRREAADVRGDQRHAAERHAGPRYRRAALHRADTPAVGAGADQQRVELSRNPRSRRLSPGWPADRGRPICRSSSSATWRRLVRRRCKTWRRGPGCPS